MPVRAPGEGACGPLCVIQPVNCSGPATAERAAEPRGVIIYDAAQRRLPGTGMDRALCGADGKLNSNFLLRGLGYTPPGARTPGHRPDERVFPSCSRFHLSASARRRPLPRRPLGPALNSLPAI